MGRKERTLSTKSLTPERQHAVAASTSRYEVVLLEDDPETRELIGAELRRRGIIVHSFARGEDALRKIVQHSGIGAVLTDIEILESFPDGDFAEMQGYDVANRLLTDAGTRLLSVVVMTHLPAEMAFSSLNSFQGPVATFHKQELQAIDPADVGSGFDRLAKLLKREIERTPHAFYEELCAKHPKSGWIKRGYWQLYRSLWLSRRWVEREHVVDDAAAEIVRSYLGGDETRPLRGGVLSISRSDVEGFLKARRVVYGLRMLAPIKWESLCRGRNTGDSSTVKANDVTMDDLIAGPGSYVMTEQCRQLLSKFYHLANTKIPSAMSSDDETENTEAMALAAIGITAIRKQLAAEDTRVQFLVGQYLDNWQTNTHGDAAEGKATKKWDVTLNELGIRREDISVSDPDAWRFLLPEERSWLRRLQPDNAE